MKHLIMLTKMLLQEKKHVLLAIFFGLLASCASVGLMAAAALLISKSALHPPLYALTLTIIAVRFFGLTRAGTRYLERYFSHKAALAILGRLRVHFYERVEPLAPAVFSRYRSGDLLSRVVSDVENLQYFFLRVAYPPIIMVLVFIITGSFLAYYSINLALILLIGFTVSCIILPILMTLFRERLGKNLRQESSNLSSATTEYLYGYYDLKTNNRLAERTTDLKNISDRLINNQLKAATSFSINEGLLHTCSYITAWIMLVMGIYLVEQNVILGVHLAMLVLATLMVFESAMPMAAIPGHIDENKTSAQRLYDITQNVKSNKDCYAQENQIQPDQMVIDIIDVTFSYPNQDTPALKNINLKLEHNKKIAVVGPSGSGKSSILNILLRFYNYQKGQVFFGGHDLMKYHPERVRDFFGVVAQNNHYFNTTLRQNLILAKPDAEDKELLEVLNKVSLSHVSLDFNIGEKGLALSGGERQRLAFARMILKDAPMVLLDEPTNGLDAVTEGEVFSNLWPLIDGKPVLYITHKISGLKHMDEIIVLNKGEIVERGTYSELMEKRDYFYCLRQMELDRLKVFV